MKTYTTKIAKNGDTIILSDYEEIIEADAEDYAVSTEAQDAAIDAEIEQATDEANEEPEITKAEKIATVIADAKDFIATNLDAHTEKVFKLCFGIHAGIHFYLNNLKGELFREIHTIEDEMLKFKGTEKKFYDAYIAASDGYLDSEEMTALYSHICDCVKTPYSNKAWGETRKIAEEILDKLGEETLMRELAKVTDEFGISRDLLNQSDSCNFKPFNLDTPPETPAHAENESEDDFELYPIDVAIYHGGDILNADELEDYAAQFRDAITANGNFGTVEIGEFYLSVYGNTGGDNKTIWKLIGDLCWRGDCCLEGYGSKETDYELREMPGEEIDAMLARMGIDNDPPAFVIPEFDAAVKKVFGDDAPAFLTPCGQVTLELANEPEIKTTTDPDDADTYFCPAELKPELVAALKDIYVADTFAAPDENDNVPIIPAVDFFAFAAPLYLTDICTTAYHKNPDGTFSEDTAAFNRLEAIETKIFQTNESTPKHESSAEINARIDGYLNTAYNLEGMAEELEIICDNFDDDARDEKDRHVASRISFYVDHVKRGIEGLREMIDWYIQRADFAESNAK